MHVERFQIVQARGGKGLRWGEGSWLSVPINLELCYSGACGEDVSLKLDITEELLNDYS